MSPARCWPTNMNSKANWATWDHGSTESNSEGPDEKALQRSRSFAGVARAVPRLLGGAVSGRPSCLQRRSSAARPPPVVLPGVSGERAFLAGNRGKLGKRVPADGLLCGSDRL